MAQLFFPPTSETKKQEVCCYINESDKVIIAKISGLENRDCERVVFPSEKFIFMANDECELEIHSSTNVGTIKNVITCSKLKVTEEEKKKYF